MIFLRVWVERMARSLISRTNKYLRTSYCVAPNHAKRDYSFRLRVRRGRREWGKRQWFVDSSYVSESYLASVWDSHQSGSRSIARCTTSSRINFTMAKEVIGVDGYNQTLTGDVTMTVTCAASDCHHIPLVITKIRRKSKGNESNKRRKEEDC